MSIRWIHTGEDLRNAAHYTALQSSKNRTIRGAKYINLITFCQCEARQGSLGLDTYEYVRIYLCIFNRSAWVTTGVTVRDANCSLER